MWKTLNTSEFKALGFRAIMLANWDHELLNPHLMQNVKQADDIIFQASSVFPFMLFPDTITADRVKVTVTGRVFFATAQVSSISYEDLMNVETSVGPFFGSVKLWSQVFTERATEYTKPLEINYLSRKNSLEAECLLQGFIIAKHKHIDTDQMPRPQLLPLLEQLGKEAPKH